MAHVERKVLRQLGRTVITCPFITWLRNWSFFNQPSYSYREKICRVVQLRDGWSYRTDGKWPALHLPVWAVRAGPECTGRRLSPTRRVGCEFPLRYHFNYIISKRSLGIDYIVGVILEERRRNLGQAESLFGIHGKLTFYVIAILIVVIVYSN